MKVLTVKEPYASLILNEIKHIETRSWNTKYRGTIYINAGLTKITKEKLNNKELMNLCKNIEYGFGNIICKCNLIDCIYMDERFISNIKNNKNEYICGRYEIGRYAWILSDVERVTKIPVKGQLGIWNYYNEDDKNEVECL